ncbi:MAG: HAMP domain-containing sensor histidine kinase, partial [Jatrophihabitantaceae bacterium]
NAAAAMRAGGTVSIAAEPGSRCDGDDEQVSIRVSDTGAGLTDSELARVFEPFFSTGSRRPGAGLGLAAVHGMVRQNQGRIVVRSTPGRGTTVHVLLPAANPGPDPVPSGDSGGSR